MKRFLYVASTCIVMGLLMAMGVARTEGKQAGSASTLRLAPSNLASTLASNFAPLLATGDPDLCALLPSGGGWAVRPVGTSTDGCIVTWIANTLPNPNILDAEVHKYGSDVVRKDVQQMHDTDQGAGFTVNATTDFGDPGYAYYATRANSVPAGFFARGCYLVQVRGTLLPATMNDMRPLLISIDAALKQAPCSGGAGANPTPTSAPAGGQSNWRVTITKLEDVQWFGTTPPVWRPAAVNQTPAELKEGFELPQDQTRIETRGFRVHTAWRRQNADGSVETKEVVLGPGSFVNLNYLADPSKSAVKANLQILDGIAEEIAPESGQSTTNLKFLFNTPTEFAGIRGSDVTIAHDDKADVTTIQVKQGIVDVTPVNPSLQGLTLQAGQQVTVSATSISPVTPYISIPGDPGAFFPETGKIATGIFMDYWQTHGALAQQGYPISGLMQEVSDLNGKTYTVQYFERAVFEYHPEFTPPNDVLLSQLGTFQYKRKYPSGAPNQHSDQTNGHFFQETGHWVGGTFWDYWQKHGGLAQQGYPISDEFTEVSETDGKPYTVQYFERAVFEQHPEFSPPNNVLLSLLGSFFYKQKYGGGNSGNGGNGGGATNCSDTMNLAAASNGGSVVEWSSGSGVEKLIDGNPSTSWVSGPGAVANQYIIVGLSGNKVYNINRVRINPSANGGDPADADLKEFEIRVSTDSADPAAPKTVFKGTIPNNQNAPFDFTFPPVQAKYVGIYEQSNFGNSRMLEIAELEVYAYSATPTSNCSGAAGGGGSGGTTQPTATPVSGGGGGSGGGQCANIPAPINMTITPSNCAAAGNAFFFAGRGFQPGETVGVYATAPDGSVLGAPFQVTADQNGVTSGGGGVTLTTHTNTTPGVYALTMEGVTSHNKAIGYIRVLAP